MSSLLAGLAISPIGCLHDQQPAQLRGEVTHENGLYVVRECTTDRRYELGLNTHAEVTLQRHIARVREEATGPILVELGGKSLPATPSTDADALFDVRAQYAVRPGACP